MVVWILAPSRPSHLHGIAFIYHPTYQVLVVLANEGWWRSWDWRAEPSAAFILSLGSLLTASSAYAATTEKALASASSLAAQTQVPDAAVDQATSQIIAAVKVAAGAVKSGLDVAADGAFKAKDVSSPFFPCFPKCFCYRSRRHRSCCCCCCRRCCFSCCCNFLEIPIHITSFVFSMELALILECNDVDLHQSLCEPRYDCLVNNSRHCGF